MRTTVTLDDEIAIRVNELAHRNRSSFKQTLNALLRKGLAMESRPSPGLEPFVVKTHRGGFKPGVDARKLSQLADQLAVDDFIRKAGR